MLFQYLERVRAMDRAARERHAVLISTILTSCIILVWLITLVVGTWHQSGVQESEDGEGDTAPWSLKSWLASQADEMSQFTKETMPIPVQSVWNLDFATSSTATSPQELGQQSYDHGGAWATSSEQYGPGAYGGTTTEAATDTQFH